MTIKRRYLTLVVATLIAVWVIADSHPELTVFHVCIGMLTAPVLVYHLLESFIIMPQPTVEVRAQEINQELYIRQFNLLNLIITTGFIGSVLVLAVFKTYFVVSELGYYTLMVFVGLNSFSLFLMYQLAVKHQKALQTIEKFNKDYYLFTNKP